jgi:hypothetical protein
LLPIFSKALGFDLSTISSEEKAIFVERARAFLVDNERGKKIAVRVGEKVYSVGETTPNGHFQGRISLSQRAYERLGTSANAATPIIHFHAVLSRNDDRVMAGAIHLLDANGLSVISDTVSKG